MPNNTFYLVTQFDEKYNKNIYSKYLNLNDQDRFYVYSVFESIIDNQFINVDTVKVLIQRAGLLSKEPLEEKPDSVDQILKCIIRQLGNYISYQKDNPDFEIKGKLSSLKVIAFIAFNLTKGHFLANGNKRIAFITMTYFLDFFGYHIIDIENSWDEIYEEWKFISAIPGTKHQKGIDRTYDLMLDIIVVTK